jgi:hypothetical protein
MGIRLQTIITVHFGDDVVEDVRTNLERIMGSTPLAPSEHSQECRLEQLPGIIQEELDRRGGRLTITGIGVRYS